VIPTIGSGRGHISNINAMVPFLMIFCLWQPPSLLSDLGQCYIHPHTAPAVARERGKKAMVLLSLLPEHSFSAGAKCRCRGAGHK